MGEARAPDAEDEAPPADLVDGGDLLGHAQGMAERQHLDGRADLHAAGALGDGRGQDQRRGQHRALGREMQLGEPHGIEPPALGRIDLGEGLRKSLRRPHAGRPLKLVKHAEFHRSSSMRAVSA